MLLWLISGEWWRLAAGNSRESSSKSNEAFDRDTACGASWSAAWRLSGELLTTCGVLWSWAWIISGESHTTCSVLWSWAWNISGESHITCGVLWSWAWNTSGESHITCGVLWSWAWIIPGESHTACSVLWSWAWNISGESHTTCSVLWLKSCMLYAVVRGALRILQAWGYADASGALEYGVRCGRGVPLPLEEESVEGVVPFT